MVSRHARLCLTPAFLILLSGLLPSSAAAQVPTSPFTQLVVNGAHYFTEPAIQRMLSLEPGAALPKSPSDLADDLARRYRQEGYAFARVDARFDAQAGRLALDVDEGRIGAVEFAGVPVRTAREFAEDFALQPGDVFRQPQANDALTALLATSEGAIRPEGEKRYSRTRPRDSSIGPFEMVDRDGTRALVVHLDVRRNAFNMSLGSNGSEDWFNPVDGFAPAVGFNHTVYDPVGSNHAYITGYVSYKFASERAGYTVGFEKALLGARRLSLGAELHDQTASDDLWRVTVIEQSLAAAALRKTLRDYYERRGYQLNAAVRVADDQEILFAWRDERHESLVNRTDFSFFRRDADWRPNAVAQTGRLRGFVVGYTWDSRGLTGEPRGTRYERHQMANLFGSRAGSESGWRVEWTSEIASPSLRGDFDFRRHIVNVRRYSRFSPSQSLDLRGIVGIGEGSLPPQRLFGVGGLGSVAGFSFKESIGERMLLLNAEYRYRFVRESGPLLMFDAGRVFRPVAPASSEGWLKSIGAGLAIGDEFRIAVFWPLERNRSAKFVLRFSPTF